MKTTTKMLFDIINSTPKWFNYECHILILEPDSKLVYSKSVSNPKFMAAGLNCEDAIDFLYNRYRTDMTFLILAQIRNHCLAILSNTASIYGTCRKLYPKFFNVNGEVEGIEFTIYFPESFDPKEDYYEGF